MFVFFAVYLKYQMIFGDILFNFRIFDLVGLHGCLQEFVVS